MKTKNILNYFALACCSLGAALLISSKASPLKNKHVHFDKIMGADISWLPMLEDNGRKFYDNGTQKDMLQILKDHGFNYIRLRIFNNPAADSGYSKKGYCDLANTEKMATRIKSAGMGFLLDFHYSDNWADPGNMPTFSNCRIRLPHSLKIPSWL